MRWILVPESSKEACYRVTNCINATATEVDLNGERVCIEFKTHDQASKFYALICSRPLFSSKASFFTYRVFFKFKDNPNYSSLLEDFFAELIKFDSSVKEILHEICLFYKLSPILGLAWEKLKEFTVEDAIEKAQKFQETKPDFIWQLLELYEQDSISQKPQYPDISSTVLYNLANSISLQNPHYRPAQDKCVDILMRVEITSKEEAEDYLELKFRHALNGTRQDLVDHLFHELCGEQIGKDIQFDIKGEADTLLQLARRMKSLNKRLQKELHPINNNTYFTQSLAANRDQDKPISLQLNI